METEFCSAVDTFYKATENDTRSRASEWLQSFEQSDSAWGVVTSTIPSTSTGVSVEARLFASQVLRRKVVRDLYKLTIPECFQLRDAVLGMLSNQHSWHSTIVIQLCCTLAELAIHFPSWENPVSTVNELFGSKSETFPYFLEFITVLPEELIRCQRVFTREEFRNRFSELLVTNAEACFKTLVSYLSSSGFTDAIRKKLFVCIENWVSASAVPFPIVISSPLLEISFKALSSDLIDSAASILAAIYDMAQQDVNNGSAVGISIVQRSLPGLLQCRSLLNQANEDEETARALIKLTAAACQCLLPIILSEPLQLMEMLMTLLVPISGVPFLELHEPIFEFWYFLTDAVIEPSCPQTIVMGGLYQELQSQMLKHLEYPVDPREMSGKERDEFRENRHEVGAVLKNCVHVLGERGVLESLYRLLRVEQSQQDERNGKAGTSSGGSAAIEWRRAEAIFFALRSVSSTINPCEETFIVEIMGMLPSIMESFHGHPMIRYAILLFIGGYTRWTALHPSYLAFQMSFVSAGFSVSEANCSSAAARTLRHLGEDCGPGLHPYMGQLHPFYVASLQNLSNEDAMVVSEAVAFIILAAPSNEMLGLLSMFTAPHIEVLVKHTDYSIGTLKNVLNRLSVFFCIVHPKQGILEALDRLPSLADGAGGSGSSGGISLSSSSPSTAVGKEASLFDEKMPLVTHPVMVLLNSVWPHLVKLLEVYPVEDEITESVCRILRNSLKHECAKSFSAAALQRMVELLVKMYDATSFSCWLWVSSHVVNRFSAAASLIPGLFGFVERMTQITILYVERSGIQIAFENIHELFSTMSTVLPIMPERVLQWDQMLTPLLRLAVGAFHLDYPKTVNATAYFVCDLLQKLPAAAAQSTVPATSNAGAVAAAKAAAASTSAQMGSAEAAAAAVAAGGSMSVLIEAARTVGGDLVRVLLYRRVIDRALPYEAHKHSVGVLKALAVQFPDEFGDWVGGALAVFPRFFNTIEAAAIVLEFRRGSLECGQQRIRDIIEKMVRLHERRTGKSAADQYAG